MVPPVREGKNVLLITHTFDIANNLISVLFQENQTSNGFLNLCSTISKERSFCGKYIVSGQYAETLRRHNRVTIMDKGKCSEIDTKGTDIKSASEIYFPWGHGARCCVSMAPAFLSVVVILAKVDSYRHFCWCIRTFCAWRPLMETEY